jgi:hypothetical protein
MTSGRNFSRPLGKKTVIAHNWSKTVCFEPLKKKKKKKNKQQAASQNKFS